MVDEGGRAVPHDCTLCHSILAYDSEGPYQFLGSPDPQGREKAMHLYLQREFLGGGGKAPK